MAKRINKLGTPTEASRIYDYYYGKLAADNNYEISNDYKTLIIEDIFKQLDYEYKEAIRLNVKNRNITHPNVWKKVMSKYVYKVYAKNLAIGNKHMMSPLSIEKAVAGFYSNKSLCKTPLTKWDFGGKQYIITALNKKSEIYYREQLLKHLSMGWHYLWTIPGCGDGARQSILEAIDRWNEKENG